jgi:hypothetical protein
MDYLHQLTRLRTDTNRNRWTDATVHRAPHRPFLLLSILDLAAQGQIAYSTGKWPEIPQHGGHQFHGMMASESMGK